MDFFKLEFFTIKDFTKHNEGDVNVVSTDPYGVAKLFVAYANEKLASSLGPKVYGYELDNEWTAFSPHINKLSTHQAHLFNIQPIVKECMHEPDEKEGLTRGPGLMVFSTKCKHCGVELVVEWYPAGKAKE